MSYSKETAGEMLRDIEGGPGRHEGRGRHGGQGHQGGHPGDHDLPGGIGSKGGEGLLSERGLQGEVVLIGGLELITDRLKITIESQQPTKMSKIESSRCRDCSAPG